MSAQPPTSPRIEDLRARLRLDPKARHFYPLAEELRKLDQLDEAEKILHEGLIHHPSYLSAWVSLGRVLADKGKHPEAVEALMKALALDPGNVVCANLLATSYLAMGEKVEALKKLKLVRAVMPGDEVDEQIAALEKEIESGAARSAGFAPPPAASEPPQETSAAPAVAEAALAPPAAPEPASAQADAAPGAFAAEALAGAAPEVAPEASAPESSVAEPSSPLANEAPEAPSWQPPAPNLFLSEPDEEPYPEPERSAQAADLLPEEVFPPAGTPEVAVPDAIPQVPGGHVMQATEREPGPFTVPEEGTEPFAQESTPPAEDAWQVEPEEPAPQPAAAADEQTTTLTMADLYARQGHDSAAREIYERVLEKDPANEGVRERLAALSSGAAAAGPERERRLAAAARLERWLDKVGRREL